MRRLNRHSPVPLHHQVEQYLRAKIRQEELRPGDPLPSELQLANQFSISRITVRQALARLQFEGLVERRPGKGTFVSRPKLVHRDGLMQSIEEEVQAQGRSPGFHLISYAELEAPRKVQEHLGCTPDELVFRLERLKLLDAEPWAIETRFFPQRIGKVLDKRNIEVLPIFKLLATVLGHAPKRLVETIGCSVASQDEGHILRIPLGYAVLVSEHTMFDEDNLPVEYGKTIFRGDRYQVRLEFWRNP